MDLEKQRNLKGWSQAKLSEISGVSQTYISDLEANKKNPTIPIVKKLALALCISVTELLGDDENSSKAEAS